MNLLRPLTSPVPVPASWYAIPLRLIVGFGFIQHGYAKLARGPEDFIGVLHAMGLPSSFLLGWLMIVVELVVGLMILVGVLIPLATLPMRLARPTSILDPFWRDVKRGILATFQPWVRSSASTGARRREPVHRVGCAPSPALLLCPCLLAV